MNKDYAITFFYYDDFMKVVPFYENVMGFEMVLDQGMARIYRVAGRSYFGIVDGNKGHCRHQPQSAVLLTVVAEDVEAWYAHIKAHKAANLSEMIHGRNLDHFFFEDPAGYNIEIQRFRDPEVARLF